MSREQKLSKKIAHTLLAMSIVYSGGMNVLCNTAFAAGKGADGADKKENVKVTDSFYTDTYTGNDGADGAAGNTGESGGNGGKTVIELTGSENVVNNISFTATGGKGGVGRQDVDYNDKGYGGNGGAGSDTAVNLTVTGADVTHQDVSLTATGGAGSVSGAGNASVYNTPVLSDETGGNGGVGGRAEASITVSGQKYTADNVTLSATGGDGGNSQNITNGGYDGSQDQLVVDAGGNVARIGAGGAGGSASASGFVLSAGSSRVETVTAADVVITATGGKGGSNTQSSGYISGAFGGIGGAAAAYGIKIAALLPQEVAFSVDSISVTASGGAGGDINITVHDAVKLVAAGGNADAYGIFNNKGSLVASVTGDITAEATGGAAGGMAPGKKGKGGSYGGGTGRDGIAGRNGSTLIGSTAVAVGSYNEAGRSAIQAGDITATVTGGIGSKDADGGEGGTGGYGGGVGGNGAVGGNGGTGGTGIAAGVQNINGISLITAAKLSANETGGTGGAGGAGGAGGKGGESMYGGGNVSGNGGNGGNGGTGGIGGNAFAYGVQSSGGTTELVVDAIVAAAAGGTGGSAGAAGAAGNAGDSYGGGSVGSNGLAGSAGTAGSIAAEAKAYGIYAEQNAVVDLHAKTNNGTIKIGAKADNATSAEAYAVYADNAIVLFHDKAELNTSDGVSTTDNSVLTSLNNATLGFGGTAANRTVTGGTLKLAGSNTFRVNTDLAAGMADKFTFDSLAAGSSKAAQYITVGYDAALDPYKEGSTGANGGTPIDVLEITNLNGQDLSNFTGGTTTLDSVLYQYNSTTNVKVENNKVQITGVTTTKTPFATESVKTASDAQMAMGSMWRIEGNNLMKRMGELRSDKEAAKSGVWARYYRGELSADSAYDRSFSQDYTAFQGGIDKVQDYKGGKLYTGIAVNRIDSNAGYTAGSGDLSSTGVGVYASWLGSKGHYLDLIARGSKLTNDFKFVDSSNNAAKADYDTWAYGISAEYGYRQDLNAGWFVEPQAELSLGHIGSADYTMSNGGRIENDGVDSAVTRVGILGGKEFTIGGRPSNAYVKASLLHDFGGNGGATGYYGSDSLALQTGDLTGTWYEIGLGANLGIAKNSNLYFDALKTFGGDLRTDWQFNAGLRFTF